MWENTQLVDAIIETAKPADDKKELPCVEAFSIAERFGVEKREVGRICNAYKIKICNCQLGCFQ
ncbi:MAG TPA: hypothetical protein VMX13_02445 [Sedimentisphaerales bacterium]|nr:hypothetical protein [Sedimentisphaerales bacterium]